MSASRVSSAMTGARLLPRDLLGHLTIVQGHYAKFSRAIRPAQRRCRPLTTAPARTTRACSITSQRSVQAADRGGADGRALASGRLSRAFRSETTRSAFADFVPALIEGLALAEEPDRAVVAFDRFLQSLQRGGRLISLLAQNRDLVALVALVLGAAPRLGDMLARQPQLMDGLIDPRFFGAMPDRRRIVGTAGGDPGRSGFLRGVSRSPAPVRTGKPVPDRHPHPHRNRHGAAGQRSPSPTSPRGSSIRSMAWSADQFAEQHGRIRDRRRQFSRWGGSAAVK